MFGKLRRQSDAMLVALSELHRCGVSELVRSERIRIQLHKCPRRGIPRRNAPWFLFSEVHKLYAVGAAKLRAPADQPTFAIMHLTGF
mmetsp:Transcript_76759/g.170055  ORF Transcript_76759/g.170055 Transcript_76759/m.170055 type:complete len:87 (+) Transcript_76759:660-920(+)